ncbi:hypothetical protein L1049_023674 [Liquidambar formosana]|uniref:Bifunctional inhibitor/plant lipid transfer protein/seed storage helical domain-containing protein n=1 Tax=Liquidambar formosana TaxID=63359 RepID=A0AAP0X474_LIQFO
MGRNDAGQCRLTTNDSTNNDRWLARPLVCQTFFLLVLGSVIAQPTSDDPSDPNCRDVVWDFLQCTEFLFGYDSFPSRNCCDQLKDMNLIANSKGCRQRIGHCIQNMVNSMGTLIPSRVEDLPTMCGVRLGYPIADK